MTGKKYPTEPMTPEEEAAFLERVDAFFGKTAPDLLLKAADHILQEDPYIHARHIVNLLRGGLESLKHYIEDPEVQDVSWENPWTELHYPVRWDWEEGGLASFKPEDIPKAALDTIMDALQKGEDPLKVGGDTAADLFSPMLAQILGEERVLFGLTHNMGVHIKDGQEAGYFFLHHETKRELDALAEEDRYEKLADLLEPYRIGGLEIIDEAGEKHYLTPLDHEEAEPGSLPPAIDEIEEKLRTIPKLSFKGDASGTDFQGSVVFMVYPLVVDEDKKEAYFPIVTGLVIAPGEGGLLVYSPEAEDPLEKASEDAATAAMNAVNPETWSESDRADLWKFLLEDTPKNLLAAFGVPEENAAEIAAPETPPTTSAIALKPVGAPSPERMEEVERRRSVMSPYPLPRTLAKEAHTLALNRGLGRMFGSASKIPDLDFQGEAALVEAEALFWAALEDHLEKALAGRRPPVSWQKETRSDGKTTIVFLGLQEDEVRTLWSSALRGMNATEKGPGLEVAVPTFKSENYFDQATRQVRIETRLVLWPEDHLRTREGDPLPPVRFRSERSPGYLDLLDRQGPRPFFADGWLWLPRGNEREGFRIAGLPRLLFPEGRKALERLARKGKGEHEAELNRLLREPSLFRDVDAKVVRDLRRAIAKTEAWLKELSVYDTRDLTLCIFEAWHRQRDAWFREAVVLEDGKEVSTKPYRIIRLDPEDLRLRLDPKAAAGDNWRGRLFKRLEALTTFERQTRDRKGRKVDVGDRLVERIIDGFRGVDEEKTPEQDTGLGLTRRLKKAGGIPSRSFYAVVSVDFMERLVTWAIDEKGAVRWGLEAAKAAERAALVASPEKPKEARQVAQEKRSESKGKPYFDGSPRLMSLSNLEDWPQDVKDLAHVLLQEVTHKKGEKRLDGRDFVACAGSHGKGYTVRAWVMKWGSHLLRTGPRGGVQAFTGFLEALRFLSSHDTLNVKVELRPPRKRGETHFQKSKWNGDALAVLGSYGDNPPAVYDLKLIPYLPEDLEDRLRKRLSEDGIDGVDEDEAGASVFTPSVPGGLSPADIRGARKRAGWEQAELASKVGVSRVAVSYWENAKKPVPKDRVARLREVLGPYLEEKVEAVGVTRESPKDPPA